MLDITSRSTSTALAFFTLTFLALIHNNAFALPAPRTYLLLDPMDVPVTTVVTSSGTGGTVVETSTYTTGIEPFMASMGPEWPTGGG